MSTAFSIPVSFSEGGRSANTSCGICSLVAGAVWIIVQAAAAGADIHECRTGGLESDVTERQKNRRSVRSCFDKVSSMTLSCLLKTGNCIAYATEAQQPSGRELFRNAGAPRCLRVDADVDGTRLRKKASVNAQRSAPHRSAISASSEVLRVDADID